MKLPDTVRVLGREYTILREPDSTNMGSCHNALGVINVTPEQDAFSAKDTLLHELMHAILHQQGYTHSYKKEEAFVRPLATGIMTVLQDNPAFAKWLAAPLRK